MSVPGTDRFRTRSPIRFAQPRAPCPSSVCRRGWQAWTRNSRRCRYTVLTDALADEW